MNCVVAAQGGLLGELAGLACELYVDADERQLPVQRLEALERTCVRGGGKPGAAPCCRERRATLGVGEDARNPRMRSPPQLARQLRSLLGDHELDERRGVEIKDQRRCSATSSETGPRAFTCARRAARCRLGGVTRPRRTRSCRGSLSLTAESRAIGRPRRVTSTSAPP